MVENFYWQSGIIYAMKPFIKDLSFGSFGTDVFLLQDYLESIGYGDFVPTGFYGSKTREAVQAIQKDNNIEPISGYFGPKTRNLVNNGKVSLNREKIYNTAVKLLNIDVTPEDIVPDEVDCADTVSVVLKTAGFDIGNFRLTTDLYRYLLFKGENWREVFKPLRGDIIISPTGYGNGKLTSGHVGIMLNSYDIASNKSATGIFCKNYNLDSWRQRYRDIGGFPIVFIRKL